MAVGDEQSRTNVENAAPKERKTNSWSRANILSKVSFTWMMPLFFKGLRKDLSTTDICKPMDKDLSEAVANKLEQKWFEEISKCRISGKTPSLLKALFRTFISDCIFDGFLLFFQNIICKSFQPVFLALLIEYFRPNSNVTKNQAYYYAGGIVILAFLNIFFVHHSTLRMQQLGMRLRIACCSLMYRKILRLNSVSLGKTTVGQVVNLMSNDVNRFDMVLLYLHYFWIMPFNIALVCYLIYTQVSTAALIGVASITLQTLPVQGYMSKLSSRLRAKIAKKTDERVRIMNEIISGIQVIKMYAWEKPFEKVVAKARENEIIDITKASYLRGVYMSFMVFTERATLYVTVLAYSLMGNRITSATVFSLAQFYNILQALMAIVFPTAVSTAAECTVTIKRLQEFLLQEELPDLELVPVGFNIKKILNSKQIKSDNDGIYLYGLHKKTDLEETGVKNLGFADDDSSATTVLADYAIEINNVTAAWTKDNNTLENMTIKVPHGKLCAIIGSVGSGKSSILQLLLKELPPKSGTLTINGSFSYSSQEPWLFVATVRNNILFGLPYEAKRYREVVKVCALEKDFQQFPRGDQTLVGERGVSLSGGQRARINLARAIYKDADIYLLDDPLSAVDAHVGRHLYGECIGRYLRGKTTILVTHQLHYLHSADMIVIVKNGRIENIGTYDELASTGEDFASLLSALAEKESTENDEKNQKVTKLKRNISQVSNGSSNLTSGEDEKPEEVIEEEQLKGKMSADVFIQYWGASGSWPFFAFMVFVMILGQISASVADYWVTFWTNEESEEEKLYYMGINSTIGSIDREFNLYDKIGPLNTLEYLYIYTGIIVACVILTISRSFLFFKVCMNSSKGLHDQMFNKILKGVMRFFDTNPSGRILNRFSKDIGSIDEMLPKATIEAVQIGLVMMSILVLVTITNIWMLIPIFIIMIVFCYVFVMYLKTAQDIKRLEGITRSPVFSHVSACLNGITTIRASNASQRLSVEFDQHQDLHTSTWYQYLSCTCTLGFWLDFVCAAFVAIVSFSFILFSKENEPSGNVGLAISQSLILTGMLQYGIRQAAEIISQMTSVERVLQYNTIEREKNIDTAEITPSTDWPSKGAVTFEHAFLKYSENDPPVLKNLNFVIENGWKVGIVGRTGAGKSSLISALFRLANIEGSIHIDEIETGKISLENLRSRISIIPQEPVLFSATLRYNLDPFGLYTDTEIWEALEAVELKEAVPSLDFIVSEGGGNFSLGQRQLVCLARAILRNNKILVLDEATANVDPQTDSFIQKTIREKFKQCTVLTIAHRLNTIMDSDRVLVMDSGETSEYDHPHILLCNQNGALSRMVAEVGPEMMATLHKVARDAYIASGGVPKESDFTEES